MEMLAMQARADESSQLVYHEIFEKNEILLFLVLNGNSTLLVLMY